MLVLANDHMSLTLAPEYGARVTGLTDLASGRQWLVAGDFASDVGADAVYGAQAARGWDECFPTVGVCTHPAWGQMRDHGALWGRPWQVVNLGQDHVENRHSNPRFAFTRALMLSANTLTAAYSVTNPGDTTLPYLWSQHCLLATTPADKIALSGYAQMTAAGTAFDWPNHPRRDLTAIGPVTEGFALKSYSTGTACAEITNPHGGIRFDWADLPGFGLWLCDGGWPASAPVHQVAVEPTTAAYDTLAQAEILGQARPLPGHDSHRWSVKITLTGPAKPSVLRGSP